MKNNIHFEVVVEGVSYRHNDFNQARELYDTLRECGFVDIFLCRKAQGQRTVYWNEKTCCFEGLG